jgi:hypothetical protein
MYLDASLDLADIEQLLHQILPLRIHLTEMDEDRRWVELEQPTELGLVPELGLRAVCSGRLCYDLLGIKVPLTIRRVQVLLTPQVSGSDSGGARLEFKLQIEEADLENVPGVVDRALMGKVNAALTPEATAMLWNFSQTMNLTVGLPERLEPLGQLLLQAPHAEVIISERAFTLRLQLAARISRTKPRPTDTAAS